MWSVPDGSRKSCGRYAPSPTGLLHIGSARTALVAWLSVRAKAGTFVLRIEDLDGPRVVPGMTEAILQDLAWLGIDWDEGPGVGGPDAPYSQSARSTYYEEALAHLHRQGRLFPCSYSRKDLLHLASAPHGSPGGYHPYPAALCPTNLSDDWYTSLGKQEGPEVAIRFLIDEAETTFEDHVMGYITERVGETVGDFVLKRRDGLYAYQLAVVVDDLLMGITEVVRGSDLLASTARQIQLIEALGGHLPTYAHVPLVVNYEGEKLSKRDQGLAIHAVRESGVGPQALIGYLGYSLGLLPKPKACTPQALVPRFSWEKLNSQAWTMPKDFIQQVKRVG